MTMKHVMRGLVPGIHAFTSLRISKTWMAGTSPAMTMKRSFFACASRRDQAPARAFSIKSGRSAFPQSGMALIFFSRSRISACSCM